MTWYSLTFSIRCGDAKRVLQNRCGVSQTLRTETIHLVVSVGISHHLEKDVRWEDEVAQRSATLGTQVSCWKLTGLLLGGFDILIISDRIWEEHQKGWIRYGPIYPCVMQRRIKVKGNWDDAAIMMRLSIWPSWDVVLTADFLEECLRDFEMLRRLRERQVEVVHQVILWHWFDGRWHVWSAIDHKMRDTPMAATNAGGTQ